MNDLPGFRIRPATSSDYAAEADIVVTAFEAGPYGHLPTTEERRAFERDSFGRAAAGTLLVAVEERLDGPDRVIGSASVLRGNT
ncbi:hypothetical protein ACC691_38350, partial [Rhizobium johnstonii]|uniref:hypothetical protein n=1 Tax=Rhizobium johnstonii TaxID=3019933 RepID=UPI003F994E23